MDNKLLKALIANLLLVALGVLGLYLLPLNFQSASYVIIILNIAFSLVLSLFILWKRNLSQVPAFLLGGRYVISVLLVATLVIMLSEAFFERTLFELADCFNELAILAGLLIVSMVSFIYFEADRRLNRRKMFYLPPVLLLSYLAFSYLAKLPYAFLKEPLIAMGFSAVLVVGTYLIARWALFASQSHAPRIRKSRS